MKRLQNYINGKLSEPISQKYLDNLDPSSGRVYSLLPDSDERDVEQAVNAARAAFSDWAATEAEERCLIMLRIADLIERDLEMLAGA